MNSTSQVSNSSTSHPALGFKKRMLVTAALPYSNGRPHVGHVAGAYLPADIYVRFLRLCGVDVRFISGSDDHGVAIVLSAEKEGKTPAEVSEHFNAKQKKSFDQLGISFDIYSSTSRNRFHSKASQDFFLTIYDKGFFEKRITQQFYDESAQMFLPDRYVKGTCSYCGAADQNGDQCESCGKMLDVETLFNPRSVKSGKPASIHPTTHWFLDLSRFEKNVETWLKSSTLRATTKKYVEGLLKVGLVQRAMTRDLTWGVPVPLSGPEAKGKVLYVWFDAPIGYISNTMELCLALDGSADRYTDWWKSDECDVVHFIGEDNTIFHCIVWIAMLTAEGSIQLPSAVVVNQFLNFQKGEGPVEKISKSRGTAIWIEDYIEEGGDPDSLRYYLTAIAPENGRTVYNPSDLMQRHNSELVNTLGNFVNRVLAFNLKYVGPVVPECPQEKVAQDDVAFISEMESTYLKVGQLLKSYSFKEAQETLFAFCRTANAYIDRKAPWTTRKTDLELTKVTLFNCIRAIKFLSITLEPFLPLTAKKIRQMLEIPVQAKIRWDDALVALPSGSGLGQPILLFQKIEKNQSELAEHSPPAAQAKT